MVRRMRGRARRSTVVFVEAVLAVAATGIAVGTPVGYTVAGVAAVAGIAGVVRRRGRGLADAAADRLRDPVDVGADLLPGLHVVDVPTRDGPGLGVVGDGQGFVVVLDAGAPRSWALADVLDLAFTDPARPAAVQVLVEQHGSADVGVDPRFGPARTYRSLPVGGLPAVDARPARGPPRAGLGPGDRRVPRRRRDRGPQRARGRRRAGDRRGGPGRHRAARARARTS